jgi:hypothetical protein
VAFQIEETLVLPESINATVIRGADTRRVVSSSVFRLPPVSPAAASSID